MSATRLRDGLVALLAVTTGATDATAFERLGHVFASVITGNLVLLGISAVHAYGTPALLAGCALAGYALGVLLAAPRDEEDPSHDVWPRTASIGLVVELIVLVAFAVMWEIDGRAPGHGEEVVLLSLCGAAMGVQSASVRRIGDMSTTYLTSTLTGLVEALAARRWLSHHGRGLAILGTALAGAAAGAAIDINAWRWLPALQLLPLLLVLLRARSLHGLTTSD